jgi:NADH-quinone oxidoreductase subunit B
MGLLNNTLPDIAPVKAIDGLVGWGRGSSIWPMTFGIACCAIEMMAVYAATFDLDRFGAGVPRATPRQSDLIIVPGTVNAKMAVRVKRLYDQMAEPRYVLAMGACVCGGGPYVKWGYNTVKGVHKIIPVDIFVPGCPPRPEALMDGILKLKERLSREAVFARRQSAAVQMDGRYALPGAAVPAGGARA